MSEVEQAEEIARGPRRRFLVNLTLVTGLLLGLALLALFWHELDRRVESAEASRLSLAQQVQAACDSQGYLDLDGRDLCKQADDVVEDPDLDRVPADGRDGVDGQDGVDGRDGADGEDGKPGKDGKPGRPGEDGADGEPGAAGADGVDGQNGADGAPGTNGADGQDGKDGADGAPGRGISEIKCLSSGDWVFTYTDGTATTVPGPCRAVQPSPTPTPTASTTKGR